MKTCRYSHAVGEFNFHIQLTPAYRRNIFENEKIRKLTEAYIVAKIEELKIKLVAIEFGPDHLHIFVADCKNYAPCRIIQFLKGFSSRMMRQNHWNLFKDYLWERNFGVRVIFAEVLARQHLKQLSIISKKLKQNIGINTPRPLGRG